MMELVTRPEEVVYEKTVVSIADENLGIMTRLQAGDPNILHELIERYQGRLRGYLIRLTSDRDLCEDLLQETWMRVIAHGTQFKGESQFATWLFAVARNLAFDTRRKLAWMKHAEPLPETGDAWHPSLVSGERSPFDYYSGKESAQVLASVIQSLNSRQREVLQLRLEQDLPLEEIARRTGIPLSSVKSRFYRGLTVLRLKLAGKSYGTNLAKASS